MEPSIHVGDRYFVNQLAYRFGEPARGDIIVFKTNGSDDAALHISRVIGLPGESVRISNGRIYIDEEIYDESASFPAIKNPGLASSSISLSSGEYFVLGDNRAVSLDSRKIPPEDIEKYADKYNEDELDEMAEEDAASALETLSAIDNRALSNSAKKKGG